MIYNEIIRYPKNHLDIVELDETARTPSLRLRFLLTCRKIHQEARILAFESTIFYFRMKYITVNLKTFHRREHLTLPSWTSRRRYPPAHLEPVLALITCIHVEIPGSLGFLPYNMSKVENLLHNLPALERISLAPSRPLAHGESAWHLAYTIGQLAHAGCHLREISIVEQPIPASSEDLAPSPVGVFQFNPTRLNLTTALAWFRERFAEYVPSLQAEAENGIYSGMVAPGTLLVHPFGGKRTVNELAMGIDSVQKARDEALAELKLREARTPDEWNDVRVRVLAKLRAWSTAQIGVRLWSNGSLRMVTVRCVTYPEAEEMGANSAA